MQPRTRFGARVMVLLAVSAWGWSVSGAEGALREPARAVTPSPRAVRPPARPPRGKRDDPTNGEPSCRKLPPGRRIVKLNLKPDSTLADLVAWISAITCKSFILSGGLAPETKKVTIFAPETMTPAEAYRVFLDALDSVGLTVEHTGRALQIIETAKAKSAPIPFYGSDGKLAATPTRGN